MSQFFFCKCFHNGRACTTMNGSFFHCDQTRMGFRHFTNQFLVNRLDEAHIDDGRIQFLTSGQGRIDHGTESQYGYIFSLAQDISFAKRECSQFFSGFNTDSCTTRITHGCRLHCNDRLFVSICRASFSLDGAMTTIFGSNEDKPYHSCPHGLRRQRRQDRNGPSANVTSRFCRATSWISWS